VNVTDIWLHINPSSGVPIYLQIKDQLRRAVQGRMLAPGTQLPTVRQMAAQLVVNPNTVARAYRELEQEGYLDPRRGVGTFVGVMPAARAQAADREAALEAAVLRFLDELDRLKATTAEGLEVLWRLDKERATRGGPRNQGREDGDD
jgi:GntR family transcriptional regulator